MKRLKGFGIPVLLLITLYVVISSVSKSANAANNSTSTTVQTQSTSLVDDTAQRLYRGRQHELKQALTRYFDAAIASGDLVGAGVSIVQGDSVLLSDGFGKRHVKQQDRVDGQTVFRLGSLSKGFAGVLAAHLKCDDQLDWNDKVSDYLPEFQFGNGRMTHHITLAHILSQTSGAPYHSYTNLIEAGLPLTDIASRFNAVTPISAPGALYSYQNAMFALSGEIMHKVAGQDISSLLNDRFFKPLQMDHTSMDYDTLAQEANVAMPHAKRRYGWNPLKLNDHYYNAIAAGGINASAEDMAKWMQLLLGRHPEIMDKTALQEAFNPFIEIKGHGKYYQRWPGHMRSYYGFGWRIHTFEEQRQEKTMWHHGGSVNDYRNEIAVFPDSDLGICVLMNMNSKLASRVIPDVYAIVTRIYKEAEVK
ncbi:serine hydrolase domain-containing protein [Geojedonia litorea]|uniref:Serine hydrolase domain-containing protein n=1 Tax=Geojedonia litorea TaxID=1268269 RepID=A0ABV9N412_9FLAO